FVKRKSGKRGRQPGTVPWECKPQASEIEISGEAGPMHSGRRTFIRLVQRGADVGTALLVDYYNELPNPGVDDASGWETRLRLALEKFKDRVAARYNEGTLHRLLLSGDAQARRAAGLALGPGGTMKETDGAPATMLHDDDRGVRQFAADALWSLWFQGSNEACSEELRRLVELRDRRKKRAGLDALIAKAANFAEAYNQRAIVHFQTKEWAKAIADCER